MIVKAYLRPIGAFMIAAGLGFIALTRFPEYGHLIAWVLILTGAVCGMVNDSAGKHSRKS